MFRYMVKAIKSPGLIYPFITNTPPTSIKTAYIIPENASLTIKYLAILKYWSFLISANFSFSLPNFSFSICSFAKDLTTDIPRSVSSIPEFIAPICFLVFIVASLNFALDFLETIYIIGIRMYIISESFQFIVSSTTKEIISLIAPTKNSSGTWWENSVISLRSVVILVIS